MTEFKPVPAVLLLEDGTIFHGNSVGKTGTTTGEICFNTGMTGYQEIFTDPSYYGQILVTTNAHIGNYGTKNQEVESADIKIAGLVCKNYTWQHHRPLADDSIQTYFERENLVGISDVDTRAIVRHIRHKGAMNAIISSETLDTKKLKRRLAKVPSMKGLELASVVSTKAPYFFGEQSSAIKVAVMDYGVKNNILKCMAHRGCYLKVFPAKTSFEEVQKWNPDGIFLSNGPGDPGAMDYAVDFTKKVLHKNIPLFGICLGHQLLARAMGVPTYKMHNGHRGINHPVKNKLTQKSEITSQNHGFGVSAEAINNALDKLLITHINLNDETIEGIKVKDKKAFSVQYHPEASPGPHDARYLFDDFINMIRLGIPQPV